MNRQYLSEQRIKEILTNLIIPLCMAIAERNNNSGFNFYLEEFYLWLPGNAGYSSIIKKIPWVNSYSKYWQGFNFGQSAIHLFEKYCLLQKCKVCPVGRK